MRKGIMLAGLFWCLVSAQAQAELASEWKFAGDAKDSVGNNHGALKGNPAWGTNRYGDAGEALALAGAADYVDCGNDGSLSFGDGTKDRPFSMEWWQKSNIAPKFKQGGKGVAVLTKEGEYYISWNNAFRLHLLNKNDTNYIGKASQDVCIKQRQWTHIAVTYDGSGTSEGIQFYQDGELAPSDREDNGRYSAMSRANSSLKIGMMSPEITFNGLIGDVRIYDHVLTPDQIKALYNIHFGGAFVASKLPGKVHKPDAFRNVAINRTATPPAIDGDLSDKTWKTASWHSDFRVFGNLEQTANPQTSFAMTHDDDNLYIAVRADEPEPAKLKALIAGHDGPVCLDDSLELFLDSEGDGVCHYRFIVNSKGVLYDSQSARGGLFDEPDWESDARAAAGVGGDAWFVEMAIPLSSLSFSHDSPGFARLNVARNRFVTGTRVVSTFAPVSGNLNDDRNFAHAFMDDIDLTPFLLDIGLETASLRPGIKDGRVTYEAAFLIENASSLTRKVDLKLAFQDGAQEPLLVLSGVKLAQGVQCRNAAFAIPLAQGKTLRFKAELQDTASHKVVCSRWFVASLEGAPLQIHVLSPPYRNSVFSGEKLEHIELEVMVDIGKEEMGKYLFELSLKPDKDAGGEISRCQTTINSEKTIVFLPVPDLEIGEYQMRGKLVYKPTGKTVAEWREPLRRLAHKDGEVRFDENHACLIDNQPFLPFGTLNDSYGGPTRGATAIREAVELGFNSISSPEGHLFLPAEVELLHRSGLKILAWPMQVFGRPTWDSVSAALTMEQKEKLRSGVQSMTHDYPEILAWYTGNEPRPRSANLEVLKQIDSIFASEDPYHPTTIINCRINEIGYYADAMSLIFPDPYPCFIKNGGCKNPRMVTDFVEEAFRVNGGRKPVWAVLQAHDLTLFGSSGQRAPSFADLRNQMYQAAAAGAKGFFWYCRPRIEPHVEIGLSYLAKEAQLLREAIFAPESSRGFAVAGDGGKSDDLLLSRRDVGNGVYLFAVSSSDQKKENAAFTAEGAGDGQLFVVGEARQVGLASGKFGDSFAPYETHIYTSNKALANQLNIADALKEIEANCTPIVKPGNLAHKIRGTKASDSLARRMEGPINCTPPVDLIIDGAKGTSSWGEADPSSWVELAFAKPEEICKVALDSNLQGFEVEVEKGSSWVKVADVKKDTPGIRRDVQIIEFPLVQTGKLRVKSMILAGNESAARETTVRIWEIEAYGASLQGGPRGK